jgi:2-polyprenyl-3-methyl-5-hydroxy-6-metoxy-1,4-benzoquinol methylase
MNENILCKVCFKPLDNSKQILAKEMMHGLPGDFIYLSCDNCLTLQLLNIPTDAAFYYPQNYYSFKTVQEKDIQTIFLKKLRADYIIHHKKNLIGILMSIGYKTRGYMFWLQESSVAFGDSILDVGSGGGDILVLFRKMGFTNLTGIDPFLENEFQSKDGSLKLLHRSIYEKQEKEQYDFIMLNHSFEHMDEPHKVFRRLAELIKPGKFVMIRTPVSNSESFNKYREKWVQLDPPRHLIVHSTVGMELLGNSHGFKLANTVFDSTTFQFWGSEQYAKGITLMDKRSLAVNKNSTLFSKKQIVEWQKLSQQLNEEKKGDQACFFFLRE